MWYNCHTIYFILLKEVHMVMTDKQMEFITWLITTTIDKCQTIEEVHELNQQIRKNF